MSRLTEKEFNRKKMLLNNLAIQYPRDKDEMLLREEAAKKRKEAQ